MAEDIKIVKKHGMGILETRDALFAMSQKCGEWPYLFATIVMNEKIMLDIPAKDHREVPGALVK